MSAVLGNADVQAALVALVLGAIKLAHWYLVRLAADEAVIEGDARHPKLSTHAKLYATNALRQKPWHVRPLTRAGTERAIEKATTRAKIRAGWRRGT